MWQMSANWLPPSPVPPRCRVLALASPRRGHDLPPPSRASVTVTVCGHGHSAVELAIENQWNSIYSISMVHDGDIIINQLEKLEAAKAAWLVWPSLLSLTGSFLVLLGPSGSFLVLLGLSASFWVKFYWPYRALLSFTGPYWALLGLTEHYLALFLHLLTD